MDHDYELASYSRTTAHIHDKERLSKPISYWREIAPKKADAEAAARTFAEQSKKKRKKKRGEEADTAEQEDRIEEAKVRQLLYRGEYY
jgi:NADH-quinone oxidoreductase subunit I